MGGVVLRLRLAQLEFVVWTRAKLLEKFRTHPLWVCERPQLSRNFEGFRFCQHAIRLFSFTIPKSYEITYIAHVILLLRLPAPNNKSDRSQPERQFFIALAAGLNAG